MIYTMSHLQNAVEELTARNIEILSIPPVPIIIEEIEDIRTG